MKLNWNFLGVGGYKTKTPSVGGEYGYFVELSITKLFAFKSNVK